VETNFLSSKPLKLVHILILLPMAKFKSETMVYLTFEHTKSLA